MPVKAILQSYTVLLVGGGSVGRGLLLKAGIGIGNMQKVSQQKVVSTEIEMKTFFTHKTWNFDFIFLQFGQFSIVSVATWWYLLWLVVSQVP